jgi:hypothetical protein
MADADRYEFRTTLTTSDSTSREAVHLQSSRIADENK